MGMFDTIHVDKPLLCPVCGAEIRSLQTKEFGSSLDDYQIGSLLSGSAVLSGIVKDRLWCEVCCKANQPSDSPVYLVVWHSVLAGVEQELGKAEARLAAVDRLDLIRWLDEAQRATARWQGNYRGLYTAVSRWHEHLARAATPAPDLDDANAERRRAFGRLFDLPDEILQAPDPLAAILARHRHEREEEADD